MSGTLQRSGGGSLGDFYLNANGELKIVFNENAENLSGRSGTINLETELKVSTITEDVVIETGIYDRDGNEILITLPIYQIDITKSGKVSTSGSIVWEIVYNTESKELENVVVTDKLPSGLAYSHSYGYLYDGDAWVRTSDLYTYNSTTGTFTFNQKSISQSKLKFIVLSMIQRLTPSKMLLKSLEIISMKNQLKQQSAMMNLRNISDF